MRRSYRGAGAVVALAASAAGVAQADVVTDWTEQLLVTIRRHGDFQLSSPGIVSRYSAIMYVSMYDAVNSISHAHEPYLGFTPCPPGTSKEAAAAVAAHRVLVQLFPGDAPELDAVLEAQLAAIPDGPAKASGVVLGEACADACIRSRADDGSTDIVEYVPGDNPGDWEPTFPDYTMAWGPQWPFVTPWCMTSSSQFRPSEGPHGYSTVAALLASPEYAADYDDVLVNGALFSTTRTEDQTLAAIYWSNDHDGTIKPPGHLFHMTQRIAEVQGNSLDQNARLFALVALALADGAIAAWDTKYATDIDLWRPISGIWEGDTDGNRATVADPTWLGLSYDPDLLIYNPPFPAWASGHAAFAAAFAAVVRNRYGTDSITFSATSDSTPGYWRTFTSLDAAARESGRSRVWLGVHWQVDADAGYEIGTAVGNYVSDNFLRRLGDLDSDGVVDGADLGLLVGAWGAVDVPADLNRDGVVDGADLGLLLGNWDP